ncbi:MAG: hypothetical protein NTY74_14410 [Ignavibacteriae bacterium]|nr:hypothetical protein [Ignavibacteriota bacterium]
MLLKFLQSVSLMIVFVFCFSGCINVIQKVKLNEDGSGTMSIRYWTKSSNVLGDELSGFGFSVEKVDSNYTSANSEPSDIRIDKDITVDSLSVVTLNLMFKEINKLSEAAAFKNIKASLVEGNEGKEFKYVLLQNQVAIHKEMKEYFLFFEFEFLGDVIYANGNVNKNIVFWKNTVADLMNNIEMIATVKLK